jgi:hypothetical protein
MGIFDWPITNFFGTMGIVSNRSTPLAPYSPNIEAQWLPSMLPHLSTPLQVKYMQLELCSNNMAYHCTYVCVGSSTKGLFT